MRMVTSPKKYLSDPRVKSMFMKERPGHKWNATSATAQEDAGSCRKQFSVVSCVFQRFPAQPPRGAPAPWTRPTPPKSAGGACAGGAFRR
eukprot:8112330-Alexandrium_andersonii.AAC.1